MSGTRHGGGYRYYTCLSLHDILGVTYNSNGEYIINQSKSANLLNKLIKHLRVIKKIISV